MARARPRDETGVGFFDHMLDLFARHSLIDTTVKVKGDTHIDDHHSVEDAGIALGEALKQALGDKKGIRSAPMSTCRMDETLTRVAVDVSGRPFLVFRTQFKAEKIGTFDTELVREFFQAFAINAGLTLSRRSMATMPTISPRAASKAWRGRCARRWRSIRARAAAWPRPRARCKGRRPWRSIRP